MKLLVPSVCTHAIVVAELLLHSAQMLCHLQSKPSYTVMYKEMQTICVICNLSVKSTNICFNGIVDLFVWSSFIYGTVFRCFGV